MQSNYLDNEIYFFGDDEQELPSFVEKLKSDGCYIGDDGHVRSKKGVLMSRIMRDGTYITSAMFEGERCSFDEARVIWQWEFGNIPEGMVVVHRDINLWDNSVSNLMLMKPGKPTSEYGSLDAPYLAIRTLGNMCGWSDKLIKNLCDSVAPKTVVVSGTKRFYDFISAGDLMKIYPILVDYTRNKSIDKEEELKNYILGLNGECGEATDIIKKVLYHGKEFDPVAFMLELGDILYYLTAICNLLGFDLCDVMMNNNAKLLARYKDGYSVEQSLGRIEDKEHK